MYWQGAVILSVEKAERKRITLEHCGNTGCLAGNKRYETYHNYGSNNYAHQDPLMTPPYHSELQPIENIWRNVKQPVARKCIEGRTILNIESRERNFQYIW
jgi:transposase